MPHQQYKTTLSLEDLKPTEITVWPMVSNLYKMGYLSKAAFPLRHEEQAVLSEHGVYNSIISGYLTINQARSLSREEAEILSIDCTYNHVASVAFHRKEKPVDIKALMPKLRRMFCGLKNKSTCFMMASITLGVSREPAMSLPTALNR